jgi:hypothetical protein
LLGLDGEPLLKAPLRERRKKLDALPLVDGVERAPYAIRQRRGGDGGGVRAGAATRQ